MLRRRNLRELPEFWRNLLLMFCIVAFAAATLYLSNDLYEGALTRSYLTQAQADLSYHCEALANELYMTYAIPNAMEGTTYYNFLRGIGSGQLPEKYDVLLPYLSNVLRNQQFLLRENEECLIYLAGTNTICTRFRTFPVAEDCFSKYLLFEETDSGEIFTCLRGHGIVRLLKMQEVRQGTAPAQRRMAVIIRPFGARIAVMTLYSEQTILRHLGLEQLPPDTYFRITGEDGDILEEYPGAAKQTADHLEISSPLPYLRAKVTVWIPRSYLSAQTALPRRAGWMMFAMTILFGILLCALLSRASTKPIVSLLQKHSGSAAEKTIAANEIVALAGILEGSENRITALQASLLSHLFVRAFNGAILSAADENSLERGLSGIQAPYRAAVLYAGNTQTLLSLADRCRVGLDTAGYADTLNANEIGILLNDTEEKLALLRRLCGQEEQASCGLSAPLAELPELHEAVRQARLALALDGGFRVYSGTSTASLFSWTQHERLYQSILSMDRQACFEMIRSAAREPYRYQASEAFYMVRFVLRSAAADLELPFHEADGTEYDLSLPPRENMEHLVSLAELIFKRLQERTRHNRSSEQDKLLAWIAEHYADCNLNAASVAAQFRIPEKRVYSIVKQLTGETFSEHLLSLRMYQIGRQLCSTDENAAEIARRCGYPSESTFYRVFKNYYGCSPRQYRENAGI